ncbi:hypothetical protein [Flavobacterium fryxellicola]|uniref:hypothetical protein n=1 Tax=Flavobacterium fryxellicola TaxID=249352 RepID=UPI0012F785F4|nr:hypothetical protein [Flavobacterium fryxellicola]
MRKLELNKMENLEGSNNCTTAAGFLCTASVFLLFGPYAPLAVATAIGCALGAYAGCAK